MIKNTTSTGKLELEIGVSDISVVVLKSTYRGKTYYPLRDDKDSSIRKAYNDVIDFARKMQRYIPDEQNIIIMSES